MHGQQNIKLLMYVVCFLLGDSPAYEDGTECSETLAITQKEAYNIQNTGKVWNQDS
jgi:hypothetical protein